MFHLLSYAWMPGTYDADTDTVYYGTGNRGNKPMARATSTDG